MSTTRKDVIDNLVSFFKAKTVLDKALDEMNKERINIRKINTDAIKFPALVSINGHKYFVDWEEGEKSEPTFVRLEDHLENE